LGFEISNVPSTVALIPLRLQPLQTIIIMTRVMFQKYSAYEIVLSGEGSKEITLSLKKTIIKITRITILVLLMAYLINFKTHKNNVR